MKTVALTIRVKAISGRSNSPVLPNRVRRSIVAIIEPIKPFAIVADDMKVGEEVVGLLTFLKAPSLWNRETTKLNGR